MLNSYVLRRLGLVLGTVVCGLCLIQTAVLAFPNPTMSGPGSDDPAGFLDVNGLAPNATAYCPNPNYFGFWTFGSGDDGAVAGTATTGEGGVTMTLTDLAGIGDGLDVSLPDHGVVFREDDAGSVALSQPMFYTQWVFVDIDLNSEGFEVTGCLGGDAQCVGGVPVAGVAVMAQNTVFDPGGAISTDQGNGYASYNVGAGSGMSPQTIDSRMQVDFLGAVDQVFLDKIGNGGAGFAVGGGCDPIGIAKEAGTPVDNGNGSFTIPFTLRILNNLPQAAVIASVLAAAEAASLPGQFEGPMAPPEIAINGLQIHDDLAAVFGSGTYMVENLDTDFLTANPNFDGDGDTALLSGTDDLQPGATATLTFDVIFTPPLGTDFPLQLFNQAIASGQAQGLTVDDLSDNGSDPGPANNNGSGGTADPTPIVINGPPAPVPADLAVTKETDQTSVSLGESVIYNIVVTNLSDTFAVPDPVATDTLPLGMVLVATAGCAEDPVGVPTCSLPPLGPMESAVYVVEARVESAEAGATLNNQVSVASELTQDDNPSNDDASADIVVGTVVDIPTLSQVGLACLVLFLMAGGWQALRRRTV